MASASSSKIFRQASLRWPAAFAAAIATPTLALSNPQWLQSQTANCEAQQQQQASAQAQKAQGVEKLDSLKTQDDSSSTGSISSIGSVSSSDSLEAPKSYGMIPDAVGEFHKLFPKRQLWQPKLEYPLWDKDWDGRHPESTSDPKADSQKLKEIRKNGVTRHIILVRHGQYDESHSEDHKKVLTELGRQQADLTGRRLRAMLDGAQEEFGPCRIRVIRVSNMARAKETADLIAAHLPVSRADPDPMLNEGRPSHTIPGGKASDSTIKKTDEGHDRIESAFRKYFHRHVGKEEEAKDVKPIDMAKNGNDESEEEIKGHPKHEFEIIVCHANVIRYFLCRALQLPPEAWLRLCTFNCSLTYLTIRPTGTVSCRMLGDIGHLPYGMSTFSMHEGFNW